MVMGGAGRWSWVSGILTTMIIIVCVPVAADLFTAMVDLERVFVAEKLVADELRQYIGREEDRLQRLTR